MSTYTYDDAVGYLQKNFVDLGKTPTTAELADLLGKTNTPLFNRINLFIKEI